MLQNKSSSTLVLKETASARTILCYAYIAMMLTAYLFYVGDSGYSSLFASKKYLFVVLHASFLGLIYCCTFLSSLLKHVGAKRDTINSVPIAPVVLAFLYTVCVWYSDLQSWYWPRVLYNMDTYGECTLVVTVYTMVFVVLTFCGKIDDVICGLFASAVTVYSIVCIMQVLGGNPFGLYREGMTFPLGDGLYYQGQFVGTIGNSNFTSMFLAISAAVLFALVAKGTRPVRWALLPPLLLSSIACVCVGADQGIVALGTTLFIFVVFVLIKNNRIRVCICGALVVAAIAVLTLVYFSDKVADYTSITPPSAVSQLRDILHGEFNLRQGSGRLGKWIETLARIPNRFFWGYGSQSMQWGDLPLSSRHSIEQGTHLVSTSAAAHNIYLNIWYSNGIFALLLYIALLTWCAVKWFKLAGKSLSVAAMGCGLCCWCVQGFFGVSNILVTPYFWILLALYLPAVYSAENNSNQN